MNIDLMKMHEFLNKHEWVGIHSVYRVVKCKSCGCMGYIMFTDQINLVNQTKNNYERWLAAAKENKELKELVIDYFGSLGLI